MSVGRILDAAAWEYYRVRRRPARGFEGVRCGYNNLGFAVYNGREGHENSDEGKDAHG